MFIQHEAEIIEKGIELSWTTWSKMRCHNANHTAVWSGGAFITKWLLYRYFRFMYADVP